MSGPNRVDEAVDGVARTSYGRLVALLAASTRDLAAAEDALSEAFEAALRTWPERGIPDRPEAWMLTAARRSLIGTHRRRETAERAAPAVAMLAEELAVPGPPPVVPDKRLELLFACAHPAIDPEIRSPLMLQAVLGLDAARIAAAFLVKPATLGQRLVRAKARIKATGIPFAVPDAEHLPERSSAVLDAIYAAYGTGWDDPLGTDPKPEGLADEAIRLGLLMTELLPGEPESRGLVALMLHSRARTAARRDHDGRFVPLAEQDVQRWSRADIEQAEHHLTIAVSLRRPGPYQLQAAIQSVHNRRALTGATDWAAIAALYDGLVAIAPSTGARVARSAALLEARGPGAALAALDELDASAVEGYQPHWVVRATALRRAGSPEEAARAAARAIALTDDASVRDHLHATFGAVDQPSRPVA